MSDRPHDARRPASRAAAASSRTAGTLFSPGELELRPSGITRLKRMARIGGAWLSESERRTAETRHTMERLREQASVLCVMHGLGLRALLAERDGVNAHYGICYEDGEIRIRLRHARTGKLLKESSLVDTLCHELAHLRHLNHGPHFRRLYQRILDDARELGYYRPGPEARAPRQAELFEGRCGTAAEGRSRRRG
jgi:hypothetical protein